MISLDKAIPADFTETLLDSLYKELVGLTAAGEALALLKQRQFPQAADAFDSLASRSGATVWVGLSAGYCHLAAGSFDDALHLLQTAVHREPRIGLAHYCLGLAWYKSGEKELARESFSAARILLPDFTAAAVYEATVLFEQNKFSESLDLLAGVQQKFPDDPDLLNQIGLVQVRGFGRAREALELFKLAKSLAQGNCATIRSNEALALRCLGDYDDSIQLYDELISASDYPYLRWQRGLALLAAQDFSRAWGDYSNRWILSDSRKHSFDYAPWRPPAATAETILVLSEQGLGDQILFSSCIPDIFRQADLAGARVVLECNEKLVRLFGRSFPAATVLARNREDDLVLARRLPRQACRQIFMGDLPGLYRRSPNDFPGSSPYLKADPGRVKFWRRRLNALGTGAKIGISWRGGLAGTNASLRSVDLRDWLPILRRPDCHFVSLQYGDTSADIAAIKQHGIAVHSWNNAIENYDETAAVTDSLDCIISVCTSLVHLAGALAKPTAVLVPAVPEWVFGGKGDTMPWYPTITLFRQARLDDWGGPVQRVAAALPIFGSRHGKAAP